MEIVDEVLERSGAEPPFAASAPLSISRLQSDAPGFRELDDFPAPDVCALIFRLLLTAEAMDALAEVER